MTGTGLHSWRSAINGSIEVTWRAGIRLATVATPTNSKNTAERERVRGAGGIEQRSQQPGDRQRTGNAQAHVVICAQRAGQAVVTSDADELRRIAPRLRLIVV